MYDSSFSSGQQKTWGITPGVKQGVHGGTTWLSLAQEYHIPKDVESGNSNCFKWSIFLSCFHTAETSLLKSQFSPFLVSRAWVRKVILSYFLDVYVQHPEFIHKATSLPLKIRAKSRSNLINISSFALQTQRAQALYCVTAGQWLTPHHQQAMKAEPQRWGQRFQLETPFTGFSANAFYVTFANSHHLSCSISVFVRPKTLHKLLVFYTRTFLEIFRRDCSTACLGCSLCYAIKVPSKPMLGQKHLC